MTTASRSPVGCDANGNARDEPTASRDLSWHEREGYCKHPHRGTPFRHCLEHRRAGAPEAAVRLDRPRLPRAMYRVYLRHTLTQYRSQCLCRDRPGKFEWTRGQFGRPNCPPKGGLSRSTWGRHTEPPRLAAPGSPICLGSTHHQHR